MDGGLCEHRRDEARIDIERFSIRRERSRIITARLTQRAEKVVRLRPHLRTRDRLLAVFLGQVQLAALGAGACHLSSAAGGAFTGTGGGDGGGSDEGICWRSAADASATPTGSGRMSRSTR